MNYLLEKQLHFYAKTEKESSQNIAFTQYIVEIMEISNLYIVEICFAISCFLSIFVKQ